MILQPHWHLVTPVCVYIRFSKMSSCRQYLQGILSHERLRFLFSCFKARDLPAHLPNQELQVAEEASFPRAQLTSA